MNCEVWALDRVCAVFNNNAALLRMRQRRLIIRYGALVSSVLTLCGLVFVTANLASLHVVVSRGCLHGKRLPAGRRVLQPVRVTCKR
jgi:hypothetical protein